MQQFIQCFQSEKIEQINSLSEQLTQRNEKLSQDKSTLNSIKFDLESIQAKVINDYYDKACKMEKQFTLIDQQYVSRNNRFLGIIDTIRVQIKRASQMILYIINKLKMEEQEIDALWNQLIKMTVELFGFQFKSVYLTKSFNNLYTNYKIFSQQKNYSQFGLWLFGFYIINILQNFQNKNISQFQEVLQSLIICPILIIFLISTKPVLFQHLESHLLYYIQNFIVLSMGIIFPKQHTEYGIFTEFFIFQTNLESLPFKIVYIVISQLIQKEIHSIMDIFVLITLLALAVYQEIHRFTSYIADYEQVEKHKLQEKQILEFLIETQNQNEKERIYRKLKKQLKDKSTKKISFDTVLDYLF